MRTGSSSSTGSGRAVITSQNPHRRVHFAPSRRKVASRSSQHSPMFGHVASSQTVWRSTSPHQRLSSAWFGPLARRTFSQGGLRAPGSVHARSVRDAHDGQVEAALARIVVAVGHRAECTLGQMRTPAAGAGVPGRSRRADADATEVRADLCGDLGHLAATVDALADVRARDEGRGGPRRSGEDGPDVRQPQQERPRRSRGRRRPAARARPIPRPARSAWATTRPSWRWVRRRPARLSEFRVAFLAARADLGVRAPFAG